MFILQHNTRLPQLLELFRAMRGMASEYELTRLVAAAGDISRFANAHNIADFTAQQQRGITRPNRPAPNPPAQSEQPILEAYQAYRQAMGK